MQPRPRLSLVTELEVTGRRFSVEVSTSPTGGTVNLSNAQEIVGAFQGKGRIVPVTLDDDLREKMWEAFVAGHRSYVINGKLKPV